MLLLKSRLTSLCGVDFEMPGTGPFDYTYGAALIEMKIDDRFKKNSL